jgi:hypothetical protein
MSAAQTRRSPAGTGLRDRTHNTSGSKLTTIEAEIAALVKASRLPLSRRDRELAAARLHRLLASRPHAAIAIADEECRHGRSRFYGRPELAPQRIAIESHTWEMKERQHRARTGFAIGIASNGRTAR